VAHVEQDLRSALPPGPFGLVVCLFGELSTFAGDDLRTVLRNVTGALAPGGRVVIELSTLAGVRRKAATTRPLWCSRSRRPHSSARSGCTSSRSLRRRSPPRSWRGCQF